MNRPGKKLNDADLIGLPLRMVISKKTLEKSLVEMKGRTEKEPRLIPKENILEKNNNSWYNI